MKIYFKEKDPQKIKTSLKKALDGRKLGELVSFGIEGAEMVITISKLGTSELRFSCKDKGDGLEYTLSKEKIAFAHRAFKDDVTGKLVSVVEQAGGSVVS